MPIPKLCLADRMTRQAAVGRLAPGRRRGVSLLEAVLYLSVAASVIVMMASVIDTESKRQEDIAMASSLNMMTVASQRYVAAEYDNIRDQLLDSAQTNDIAGFSISVGTLAEMGYLPQAFTTGDQNIFGQTYALLLRAVSASDEDAPQATMTEAEMDPDGDGVIDNYLVDLDNSNDEVTIEAILVTTGGDPVPMARGPQIAVRAQRPTAGFMNEDDISKGPYGAFTFDISGFSAFAEYPDAGHFANIIALSRFGAMDLMAAGTETGSGVPDPFQRCVDILEEDGMTPDSAPYVACLSSNDVYSDIVFNNYDSDGDGHDDVFPKIRNLTSLEMGGARDSDGDGFDDVFSDITDVYNIEMGEPVDTDGDGSPDVFSGISNVARIACGDGDDTAVEGTLIIDCDSVATTGDLIAGGDLTVGGAATADRFISSEMGGQDLSEGIYNALLLASGDTIEKPTCPAVTADGLYQMEPRVFVVPAAYSHPGGLPTVGVRAYAENASDDAWRVRLFNFVDEDRCTSSISDPLTTETTDFRTENASQCTASDGMADVYEVSESAGRVLAMTRCY